MRRTLLDAGLARSTPGRVAARIVGPAAAVAVLALGAPAGAATGSIVLITLDTTRADHLGCYGYFRETSPNLDALAAESVVYDRAYSTCGTTLPSHVSLMTATSTLDHGIKNNMMTFAPGLPTIAEVLSGSGWATAAFVSARPVGSHTGLARGFAVYDEPEGRERSAGETTERALAWLAEIEGPYFAWLHYFDPHSPYRPPPPYDVQFKPGASQAEVLEARDVPGRDDPVLIAQHAWYDGEIAYLDAELGRFLATLRERPEWTDCVIAVTADHGEGLGQHGWKGHGRLWQEQIRVPLIVRYPGAAGGGERSGRLASIADVVPTVLTAAGIRGQTVARFEGTDLRSDARVREHVISERVHRPPEVTESEREEREQGLRPAWEVPWDEGPKYAVVTEDWKYVHAVAGEDRLYHLAEDPLELRDVRTEHPGIVEKLKDHLLNALAQEAERGGGESELPPEVLDQLRALGYVR